MKGEKYQEIYRSDTIRLKDYDYSQEGCYYVTICIKDKCEYFGEIIDYEMKLSEIGKFAEKYWQEIPKHFPFVVLDEYVIMPNHIHGILCICRDEAPPRPDKTATLKCRDEAPPRPNKIATVICRDEAPPRPIISPTSSYPLNRRDEIVSRPYDNDNIYSRISPQSGSLSVIIGSFKAKCSKEIRIHYPFVKFQWQSRFYEHIIRNEKSLERIREYIRLNPQKWQFDEEYTGM